MQHSVVNISRLPILLFRCFRCSLIRCGYSFLTVLFQTNVQLMYAYYAICGTQTHQAEYIFHFISKWALALARYVHDIRWQNGHSHTDIQFGPVMK